MAKKTQKKRKALIVWGGWEGHEPRQVGEILEGQLLEHGFKVDVSDTLDAYLDTRKLKRLDLIVPIWTMGTITREQLAGLMAAVESGVGLAGCHGGMCDSFRQSCEYQFMTGAQWVAHPGNDAVRYRVKITNKTHFITRGMRNFTVTSEQYYIHVDPANKVLATTRFPTVDGPHAANGPIDVPVTYTRMWGKGRVFYTSLGHVAKTVAQAEILRMLTRGLLWAAHAEDAAKPEPRKKKASAKKRK